MSETNLNTLKSQVATILQEDWGELLFSLASVSFRRAGHLVAPVKFWIDTVASSSFVEISFLGVFKIALFIEEGLEGVKWKLGSAFIFN